MTTMGEMARQRSARDMWVSRSHLQAMLTGTVLLVGTAFGIGFLVGRGPTVPETSSAVADEQSLVALLAQVEASQHPRSGVDSLTFPTVLEGQAPVPVTKVEGQPELATAVAPAGTADAADPVPAGTHTVVAGRLHDLAEARALKAALVKAGLPAWSTLDIVDGKPTISVSIGGYPDEATARQALTDLHATAEELKIQAAVQQIRTTEPPAQPEPAKP
jgi:hypothetical protein